MRITGPLSLIAVLVLVACGGDDDGPPPYSGAGGSGGSGGSGAMDASMLDSGSDDASVDEDSSVGPVPTCVPTNDDRYVADTLSVDPSTFSLIGAPASFGLAYEVQTCGDGVDVLRFGSRDGALTPETVVNGTGDCSRAYDPVLWFTESLWRVYYWDNRGGQNQLWSLVLDSGSEPLLEVESADRGRSTIIADINGVARLAWVEQSTPPSLWTALYMRQLNDRDGDVVPLIAPEAMEHGFGFVIEGVEDVGALAWVDTASADRGVFLQPLNASGQPTGDRVKLASQVSNRSSVDIADNLEGSAVVYSTVTDNISHEVRFQTLDATGHPSGFEERIVLRSERGTDASIAPVGPSYVVAYRELPSAPGGVAKIKMFFVDKTGRRTSGAAVTVAETTADGGRVTVRSSLDGRFTIAWVEATTETQRVRMVRIPCR